MQPGPLIARYFLLWVLLAAALAAWQPRPFAAREPAIPLMLGVVMVGMGVTLQPADLARVASRPGAVALALAAQWLIMPPLAWAVAAMLGLPPALAAGVILVGAAPGGTASNVVTALSGGDVAMSVSATAASTILAPLLLPAWVLLLLGEQIHVSLGELLATTAWIVLAPVLLGIGARQVLERYRPLWAEGLAVQSPGLSAMVIAVIVGAVVALNLEELREATLPVAAAVIIHNGVGLVAGLAIGRLAGMAEAQRRACAFEVGMQNSGLAVALALSFFSPPTALAGALFSVWHNISGAAVATWLQRRDGAAGSVHPNASGRATRHQERRRE